jgi:nicotinamide-nucleotide amidase
MAENEKIHALASSVIEQCLALGLKVATAESCTGGLVAGALTGVSGSSGVVDRGFVTYSNEAKAEMLGVDKALIEAHGAVSEPVARAMAEGALAHSRADITVAITGIAGPGGGSDLKPVGLVHFACASKGSLTRHLEQRYGELGRDQVRAAAVKEALELVLERVRLIKGI